MKSVALWLIQPLPQKRDGGAWMDRRGAAGGDERLEGDGQLWNLARRNSDSRDVSDEEKRWKARGTGPWF